MKATTTEVVTVSLAKALELIQEQYDSHRMFQVTFTRRKPKKMPDGTTSTIRNMVCQLDVECFKRGGPPAYNPEDKGLFWVCDMQVAKQIRSYEKSGKPIPPHLKRDLSSPYRSVGKPELISLKIKGVSYVVS